MKHSYTKTVIQLLIVQIIVTPFLYLLSPALIILSTMLSSLIGIALISIIGNREPSWIEIKAGVMYGLIGLASLLITVILDLSNLSQKRHEKSLEKESDKIILRWPGDMKDTLSVFLASVILSAVVMSGFLNQTGPANIGLSAIVAAVVSIIYWIIAFVNKNAEN